MSEDKRKAEPRGIDMLLSPEQVRLLYSGSAIAVNDSIYFFLPFWYRVKREEMEVHGDKVLTEFSLERLPAELKDELRNIRNNILINPELQKLKVSNMSSMPSLPIKEIPKHNSDEKEDNEKSQ